MGKPFEGFKVGKGVAKRIMTSALMSFAHRAFRIESLLVMTAPTMCRHLNKAALSGHEQSMMNPC